MAETEIRRRGLRNPDQHVRLARWLHRRLLSDWGDVQIAGLVRTSGGVSYETWVIDLRDPTDARRGQLRVVLRREPLRGPYEPYDVIQEARVIEALADSAVAVPRVLATCADETVIDRRFSILEFIEGEVPDYRGIAAQFDRYDEARRRVMAREFMGVLAAFQRVDPGSMPFLADVANPPRDERERLRRAIDAMAASAERRMAGWVPHPIFADTALWCRANAPCGDATGMVLTHGDWKVGNFIWRQDRIVASLDWEGVSIGDPLQDLGYACHPAMRETHPRLMAMLVPQDELVALYEAATGRTVDRRRLHYYVIYALLFHTWTLLVGLPSIVEWDGDMRMATGFAKLNQVTRLISAEIEAFEGGRHVL